eukprot:GHVU01103911.1.p1 GENE.GHVU01103911.1~~GHVU01103911.1.p1  ORF type:complete len:130 (-),score=6.70 GHVU01103911.1:147-536(-)
MTANRQLVIFSSSSHGDLFPLRPSACVRRSLPLPETVPRGGPTCVQLPAASCSRSRESHEMDSHPPTLPSQCPHTSTQLLPPSTPAPAAISQYHEATAAQRTSRRTDSDSIESRTVNRKHNYQTQISES